MDGMSGLYPINQIGSDGFSWWIGQIESEKKDDEKKFKINLDDEILASSVFTFEQQILKEDFK